MPGRESLVPRTAMPSSIWVASTKPGAALARGQGWLPWQGRGWFMAPRDRGPEAGMHCWTGHLARGLDPAFERGLHVGPVVVDHGIPRRVAPLAAADDHVLAVDPFELCRQRGEGPAGTLVFRIGLELDPAKRQLLERVPQQQVLRLDVGARVPRRRVIPRVPDLDPEMLRLLHQVARR